MSEYPDTNGMIELNFGSLLLGSARTRSALFDRIEQEGLTIAAGRYPYPGLGGIVRVEGKRRWQPLS